MTNTERIQANNAELREAIQMAENLPEAGGEANPVIEPLEVKENGTYNAPDGVDGYNPVVVNVPSKEPRLQEKTATPGYWDDDVLPDEGYDGLSRVSVPGDRELTPQNIVEGVNIFNVTGTAEPASALAETATRQDELIAEIMTALQGKAAGGGITPTGALEITKNGTYDVTEYASAVVDVPVPDGYIVPTGTLTITESGLHDVTEYASVNVEMQGGGGDSDAEVPWLTREITEYSNPTLTTLGAYTMSGTNITSLNLPELTTIVGYAFYNCAKLANMVFPKLREIPINGCREWTGLVKADFHVLTTIKSNGFYKTTNLETLIIRTPSLCTVTTGTVWTGSKIAGGTGYVYVPKNLEEAYKSASNWSALASQIRAIEDYPEITGG